MKAVPLHPPSQASRCINRADDWTLDLQELENAFSPRTKMLVSLRILASAFFTWLLCESCFEQLQRKICLLRSDFLHWFAAS